MFNSNLDGIDKKQIVSILLMTVMFVGWAGFEIFNASTTIDALVGLMGDSKYAVCVFLSFAIMCVDLAGVIWLFAPRTTDKGDGNVHMILMGVWASVAVINALLTWWNMSTVLETGNPLAPRAMAGNMVWVPVVTAFFILVIRIGLNAMFGRILDNAINGLKSPANRARPAAVSQSHEQAFAPRQNQANPLNAIGTRAV